MQYRFATNTRINLLFSFVLLALLAAIFVLPSQFRSEAGNDKQKNKGLITRTESHVPGLENYDIRSDKSDKAAESLLRFREENGKTALAIADTREDFVKGETALRRSVPTLKVGYNSTLHIPEVIAPDVKKGQALLTEGSNRNRSEILRNFIRQNDSLVGINADQANQLEVTADYTNPNGSMAFAHLEQKINDIPVFQGEVKAGFTKDGEIVRVINNLAPNLDYDSLSVNFNDPLDAVKAAADHINYKLNAPDITRNSAASNELKVVFGEGDWATTAEKMYFPTEVGVARPAWRVLIWQPVNAFYVIVDAETGTMLWRKNITNDQTQSATYEVYANPLSMINTADSPAPLTPGPVDRNAGTQGLLINRTNVTLVGNEGSLAFNTNGWITDGSNSTDGNAVEAGLDRVSPNGVDAPVAGVNRAFSSAWNPPPGNPAPGNNPLTAEAQKGAVIQMFYIVNRYHDAMYQLGFTEQAFNFQQNNFSRGGASGDRISAEGQDGSGTNNANFATPSDGGRGRMQMYIFTGSSPNRDGTADADIIIHEVTHGTTNRLHGNAGGLSSNMSGGMGEGWGDWYAFALLSGSDDPVNGVYAGGGHILLGGFGAVGTANYYYGIRRFPKATMATTGGPNNRPHNPLTFADIDQTKINLSDGAFPPMTGPHLSSFASQVHAAGEVWSSMLWEVRAQIITRLGHVEGNKRALQVVTDAMKISPIDPTFIEGRDAILAATAANSLSTDNAADVADVWEGFRIRGMGFSATVDFKGTDTSTRVTEAFDPPNVVIANPGFAVSDAQGDNDGFPEPGEILTLTVPVTNGTGKTVNNVAVNINGGANTNYGNIAYANTIARQFSYTVPAGIGCGNSVTLDINISSSVGTRTEKRVIIIGQPEPPITENFDGVSAPALPVNWTSAQTGPGLAFVTQSGNGDTVPNSMFTPNRGQQGGNSGATLDSPNYTINAGAGVVSFRNNYNTEGGWDGGVLEISISGGAFQDILAAGGRFIEGGYNGSLGENSNPLDRRAAWTGNSGGYITTRAQLPASANGQTVKFRWRFGEDTNTSVVGWYVDTVKVTTAYTCSFNAPANKARFDYDGDGKTDISIFRPGPGEWWYLRSSDNSNYAAQFGSSSDKLVPADFTGDGKTDVAFFRPSSGEWFILRSEDNSFFAFPFGASGDIPAPADYDGDGKSDPAIFRPSDGTWYILNSGGGTTIQQFGANGDVPIVEDYDGDGKADLAIYRPMGSEWYIQRSSDMQVRGFQFGVSGDKAVPADFTGDGKADVAFWRPSSGEWYVLRSEDNSFFAFPFGANGDIPAPGDYDGDGKADATVFRPSNNTWFKLQSTSGFEAIAFGVTGDIPTPSAYIP